MEFGLTEEHLMIQDAAKEFARQELFEGVIERDENGIYPAEQIKKMGELGFMGMMVDPQYGGGGMDSLSYSLAIEEISKVDAAAAVVMSVNNSLVCWGVEKFGTEEQKQKFLVPMAEGSVIGGFCLSEPEAGSDATKQRTTAVDKGDHYVMNGTKNWITSAAHAQYFIVIAATDPTKGHKGISAFIIDRDSEGFELGPKENKMGMRASDTHSIMFNDMKVPKENRIGDEGFGFKLAMSILSGGRIGIASQALGIAQGALDLAIQYSKERKAFGKFLHEHQSVSFKLADMETEIQSARLLIHKSCWMKDQHMDLNHFSAMAKLKAAETAMYVTTEAVQIHGGYGYVREYHVERLMREAKLTQIYEGTSEVQKIVISRGLTKD